MYTQNFAKMGKISPNLFTLQPIRIKGLFTPRRKCGVFALVLAILSQMKKKLGSQKQLV